MSLYVLIYFLMCINLCDEYNLFGPIIHYTLLYTCKVSLKMKILKFHWCTRGLYFKCFANRVYNVYTACDTKLVWSTSKRLVKEGSTFKSKLKIFDLRLLTRIFRFLYFALLSRVENSVALISEVYRPIAFGQALGDYP